MALGAALDALLLRRMHPARAIVPLGSCWFALGPVLVLALAGGAGLRIDDWPLLAACVAAQIVADAASTMLAERLAYGTPPRQLVPALGWCALVDGLLAPIAFVLGVVALDRPAALAVLVPVGVLVWLLGRERRQRVDTAVEATRLQTEREDARSSARDLAAILAWTRDTAGSAGQSATAVCGASCVVLGARSAVLLERRGETWEIGGSSGQQQHEPGTPLGALDDPLSADLAETVPLEALPQELADALGPGVRSALVWVVSARRGTPRAALAVAWDSARCAARGAAALHARGARRRGARRPPAGGGDGAARRARPARLADRAAEPPRCGTRSCRGCSRGPADAAAPICVAMLDLDRFKEYNDAHGHAAGDRLLRTASAAWADVLREHDLLVRYGGEEFALVLADCDADDAVPILERLRAVMPRARRARPAWRSGDLNEAPAELVERADHALYAAKRSGRDRMVVAPSGDDSRSAA